MTTIGQYQLGCQIIYTKNEWLILEKEISLDCFGAYASRKSWAWIFRCLIKKGMNT